MAWHNQLVTLGVRDDSIADARHASPPPSYGIGSSRIPTSPYVRLSSWTKPFNATQRLLRNSMPRKHLPIPARSYPTRPISRYPREVHGDHHQTKGCQPTTSLGAKSVWSDLGCGHYASPQARWPSWLCYSNNGSQASPLGLPGC